MKISACYITLNEEENLRRSLRSCADLVDEIVVVDCGSVDATAQVAAQFGARWQHQDWLGYVDQKNLALSLASNEWILSLDADEELSPKLRAELQSIKRRGAAEAVVGFSMPRCVLYEGRWIRHGDWYPDRLVRLFRRARSRFVGGKVHERLELSGKVRPFSGELYHYSFRNADDHWARCQKYAKLWAETQCAVGKRVAFTTPYTRAAIRWLRGYIWRRGFLDGRQGRRIARFCAREVYLKYHTLRTLNHKPEVKEG
ncbi:MAG: glycosyltransferase family 2 protein [Acidobacteria bacterium]|nr:glycosyltransferase family 2 protein [Acidobacteriota bacterium]MBI3657686.1 glycosyltransferase family 2 protein [Acidobacteriota bacterium]